MFTTRKNDKSHLNFANYLLYLGMEWLKYSKDRMKLINDEVIRQVVIGIVHYKTQ